MIRDHLRRALADALYRAADRPLSVAGRVDPDDYDGDEEADPGEGGGGIAASEADACDDYDGDRPAGYRPRRIYQPWMGWHHGDP